jgi:hypothetical protein
LLTPNNEYETIKEVIGGEKEFEDTFPAKIALGV